MKERYIDGLLDPIRIDRDVIAEAKVDLGSRQFAGQYEQSPVVEGGNIVKSSWFGHISLAQFLAVRGGAPIHFFLDTAYDEKIRKRIMTHLVYWRHVGYKIICSSIMHKKSGKSSQN